MDFPVCSLSVCGDSIDISVTVKVISQNRAWKMWEFPWAGSGPCSRSSRNEGGHTQFVAMMSSLKVLSSSCGAFSDPGGKGAATR